jgi:predicted O-linked N-acetylglucosamine transferase (SPINDLY family)
MDPATLTAADALALGLQHQQRGELAPAEVAYRRVLSLEPRNADALNNLGLLAAQAGRLEIAAALLRDAVALQPSAKFHNNLGAVLRSAGQPAEAVQACRAALALAPGHAGAYCNLGAALQMLGDFTQARACYDEALRLEPGLAAAHTNVGCLLKDQGRVAEAQASFERALELDPGSAEARSNLGNCYKDQGRLEEAIACYRAAIELQPGFLTPWGGMLLSMLYSPTHTQADQLAVARGFAERFEVPLAPLLRPHANGRDPERRLRVGYLSADLRRHPVARFMEPVLERHDRARFEINCYYNFHYEDEVTRRIRAQDLRWRPIAALDDAQVAEQIRDDGIDILVDLAGHTAHNRLLLMARKPAPVQMVYLGYLGTTGLHAIDYRITDAIADQAGADAAYSEALLRLPGSMWCYRPGPEMPPVAPPPSTRTGHITFGSLCNVAKVNPGVIALWARVLAGLPSARLLMATISEGEPRARVLAEFARHGIGAGRVAFTDWLQEREFLRLYDAVDIVLDVFPCNGATTTCEALWQGVPVVNLLGGSFAGRAGASLLGNAGLGDFVAATPEAYVALALRLAGDPAQLRQLRGSLRGRLAASPVMDEAGFTRGLEAGYREAWRRWCGQGA